MNTTARQRVLAALEQAGPRGCTTAELCQPDVGGVRFSARILELRGEGHRIDDEIVRQGSWRYKLITNGAEEGAGTGPAALPSSSAAASAADPAPADAGAPLRALVWKPGSYHCCDRCGFFWHDTPWPDGCRNCGAGVHWLASFYSSRKAQLYVPLTPPGRAAA